MTRHAQLKASRAAIRAAQWERLRALLDTIVATNGFYQRRLAHLTMGSVESLGDFVRLCPLLTKKMLVADREENPPYGTNLTYPLENYTRFCQTSGTTGPPLTWLDSRDDWNSMLSAWQYIYDTAGLLAAEDRICFPFSFGPFLGFWTAFEAASRIGCMVIPMGGMSTNARLRLMLDHQVSVVITTPTYALHMGEVKREGEFADEKFAVRLFIVAGESGGSDPAVRSRIEKLWPGAHIFDHHGLTETGPVSCQQRGNVLQLRVLEEFHFVEILDPASGREVLEGEQGELVVTTLTRLGGPMLRYRTGDLVRKAYADDGALCLDGGIIGRLDDMVTVRGVNIYPSAVDEVMRRFSEIGEFQVREHRTGALLDLKILIEPQPGPRDAKLAQRVSAALRDTFQLRIEVETVTPGSLPRFEFKARRWIKEKPVS
jgi:phenylacetate-CoA ligase